MVVEITIEELVMCIDYEYLDFYPMKCLGGSSSLNCSCSLIDLSSLDLHYPQSIHPLDFLGIDYSCNPLHKHHKMPAHAAPVGLAVC